MNKRVVILFVPESDISGGNFVLSNVVAKLPKDAAIIDSRASYSSANHIFRIYSKEFPEVDTTAVAPAANFKYTASGGIEITWPTKEYEDIMLKLLNVEIKEAIKPEPAEIDLGKIFEAYAKANTSVVTTTSSLTGAMSTGCDHQWFMYGRTSSHKHCKKCGAIRENIVDKD